MPRTVTDVDWHKPSSVLRAAAKDLEYVRDDDRYIIDMADWYEFKENGKCAVCFAGAVMAGTFNAPFDKMEDVNSLEVSHQQDNAFSALDMFRRGLPASFIRIVSGSDVHLSSIIKDPPIEDYDFYFAGELDSEEIKELLRVSHVWADALEAAGY